MTYAPASLKDARRFLLDHLDIHENTTAYRTDLDPAEVGIVGDGGHTRAGNSYHLGRADLRPDSYSIVESVRDSRGLSADASALDVGDFTVTVRGKRHDLRSFSVWLVAQCEAGTADTRDIREVIYSPNGTTVKRWDRLDRRGDGDDSHLFHTHISYFRDSRKLDKTALFRRYLTEIGLLEDDVTTALETWTDAVIELTAATAKRLTSAARPVKENDKRAPGLLLQNAVIDAADAAQTTAEIKGMVADLLDLARAEKLEVPPTAEQNARATVNLLGAGGSPADIAATLRAVPHVDWAAVGQELIAGGTA